MVYISFYCVQGLRLCPISSSDGIFSFVYSFSALVSLGSLCSLLFGFHLVIGLFCSCFGCFGDNKIRPRANRFIRVCVFVVVVCMYYYLFCVVRLHGSCQFFNWFSGVVSCDLDAYLVGPVCSRDHLVTPVSDEVRQSLLDQIALTYKVDDFEN